MSPRGIGQTGGPGKAHLVGQGAGICIPFESHRAPVLRNSAHHCINMNHGVCKTQLLWNRIQWDIFIKKTRHVKNQESGKTSLVAKILQHPAEFQVAPGSCPPILRRASWGPVVFPRALHGSFQKMRGP